MEPHIELHLFFFGAVAGVVYGRGLLGAVLGNQKGSARGAPHGGTSRLFYFSIVSNLFYYYASRVINIQNNLSVIIQVFIRFSPEMSPLFASPLFTTQVAQVTVNLAIVLGELGEAERMEGLLGRALRTEK